MYQLSNNMTWRCAREIYREIFQPFIHLILSYEKEMKENKEEIKIFSRINHSQSKTSLFSQSALSHTADCYCQLQAINCLGKQRRNKSLIRLLQQKTLLTLGKHPTCKSESMYSKIDLLFLSVFEGNMKPVVKRAPIVESIAATCCIVGFNMILVWEIVTNHFKDTNYTHIHWQWFADDDRDMNVQFDVATWVSNVVLSGVKSRQGFAIFMKLFRSGTYFLPLKHPYIPAMLRHWAEAQTWKQK